MAGTPDAAIKNDVARGGQPLVGRGYPLADEGRQIDHRAGMWPPLLIVGVEQRVVRRDPLTTAASFQPRLTASLMPLL